MDLALIGCNGLEEVARENSIETKLTAVYMSRGVKTIKTFPAHVINLSNGRILYINRDSIGTYEGKSYFYPNEIDYKTIFVAAKQAGIKNIVSLSPVCSLESDWKQGALVLVRDYIDFVNRDIILDDIGADYIDMTEPFDNSINESVLKAAKTAGVEIFDGGIYLMGISGVRFETMAEIELFKRISKEKTVVGMIVPTEAQLCKLLGIGYASLSVVVNTIMSKKRTSHKDSENALTKFLQNSLKIADIIIEKGKL